jgi:PAS domain-containing protein
MKRIKSNHLVILMLGLAILLVINAMGVFAYRDEMLMAETDKRNMLSFVMKYNWLSQNLEYQAKAYITTNDKEYADNFSRLYDQYISEDKITLSFLTFPKSQRTDKVYHMNFDSNFKLTTQAQYLDFNKDEKQQYSVFLESYNAHIERIAQAFYIKDITLLHNSEYLSSTINQRFHLDELSKLYNNRLNDREHSLLFYQSFLEFTLAVLSLTLLFCCIMAYYTMIKENRSQSYFRQLYSTLVENVDVGIAIFDHHKNYVFMNSMYREILSIPLDYKVVKSLSHVLGDDKAKFIWDMVSNKSKASGELDLKIGGCEKHISYDYFIINDEYGYERYIHIKNRITSKS